MSNAAAPPTPAEVDSLVARMRLPAQCKDPAEWDRLRSDGFLARQEMIVGNQGVVGMIAREYLDRGLSPRDLKQAGNLGLIRAVDGFDPGFGKKFSTYAAYWIRHSMEKELANFGRPIRVTRHIKKALARWREEAARLADQLGEPPSRERVARELGLDHDQVERITRAEACMAYPASLEAEPASPGRDDDGPFTHVEFEALARWLDTLGERDREVVSCRYGLEGREAMSLGEVGKKLNLSKEGVRQIQERVLRKAAIMAA